MIFQPPNSAQKNGDNMKYNVDGTYYNLKNWAEFEPIKIDKKQYCFSDVSSVKYINLPFVFDCEVTSFYENGEKRATMYVWTAIVFDKTVYFGRTWEDFQNFLNRIQNAYGLSKNCRAICYVHNLAYDSHFFLPWFSVSEMFALDTHAPLSFTINECFDFKCSLRLSGLSLDKIGKDIKIGKIHGYDYDKIRHSETPLTNEEMKYCAFDVIVLYNYISQEIQNNGGKITRIAKTFTGITRRETRKRCTPDKVHMKMYKNCKITEIEIMTALENAFLGGYTHANLANAGIVLENVYSYDLSSDYPSQMVKRKFPITGFRRTHSTVLKDPDEYATLMKISFYNIRAKTHHSIISTSKIIGFDSSRATVDNGRLVSYEGIISMWITELDYLIYQMFYTWELENIEIQYVSKKGYLSDPYILQVLELYTHKTTLKGETDPDKVLLYKLAKMMINALYGMSVTNPLKTKWTYERTENETVWKEEIKPRQELLDDYNNSRSNFLAYQWGVWVTAYARYDLLRTVKQISDRAIEFDEDGRPFDDIVYCDTDSIKLLNGEKYRDIFDDFNADDERLMKLSMKNLDLNSDTYSPKDPKGNKRPLGIFVYEPNEIDASLPSYRYFKTLGAKRYIYSFVDDWERPAKIDEKTGKEIAPAAFGITIAGLPKKKNAENLVKRAIAENTTPFDLFENGMKIKAEETGKRILTYSDAGFKTILVDYLGNPCEIEERAFIHMSNAPFEMGIAADFEKLMNMRKKEYIL